MTRDELNAAVAEKVMGWKLLDRVLSGWGKGSPVWATGEDPEDVSSSPTFQGFNPTGDSSHAMMVIEALRKQGIVVRVIFFPEHVVAATDYGEGFRGDTFGEAVCRLALATAEGGAK